MTDSKARQLCMKIRRAIWNEAWEFGKHRFLCDEPNWEGHVWGWRCVGARDGATSRFVNAVLPDYRDFGAAMRLLVFLSAAHGVIWKMRGDPGHSVWITMWSEETQDWSVETDGATIGRAVMSAVLQYIDKLGLELKEERK